MPIEWTKLERKPLDAQEFDIEDPQTGAFKVSLRRLDGPEQELANEEISKLTRKYVSGGWTGQDGKFRKEPSVYPDIKGSPIKVSQELFEIAVELSMMLAEPGEKMTADQVIEFATCCDAGWLQLKGAYYIVKSGASLGDISGKDSQDG